MQIRLKGGRLVINCYQMKAKVRGWHYGAHKKQLLILTAQDIGKILEEDLICLNPSRYLGPSWEVTAVDYYGD